MIRVWNWFWYGRLCKRCKVERTHLHFTDDICMTCEIVEVINWRMRGA